MFTEGALKEVPLGCALQEVPLGYPPFSPRLQRCVKLGAQAYYGTCFEGEKFFAPTDSNLGW